MKYKFTKCLTIITALTMLVCSQSSADEFPKYNAGLIFPDKDSVVFLKKILKAMNLKFRESTKKEGKLIEWYSSSEAQKKEISERVNQHYFITKHCKGVKAPLPSEPALAVLSCKG